MVTSPEAEYRSWPYLYLNTAVMVLSVSITTVRGFSDPEASPYQWSNSQYELETASSWMRSFFA